MDPDSWKKLRELFDAALNLTASERPAFIARSCEGDPDLQGTLESLLDHSNETGSTFDRALIEAADLKDSIPTRLDLLGRTLEHYRILEKIGEGGMGEVYRATDTRLGRDVAIKILPEIYTRNPEHMARFEREAQVLASLSHPNIATIHGIEKSAGTRFLVLELLEGETLRSNLRDGPLPIETVVRWAAQIAEGLAKAHDAGVIHRDLKPANLMLTADGFMKILDFGLAKAVVELAEGSSVSPREGGLQTEPGRIMGTTSYMSPEQARGEEIDHRSDQFALGSVLYEMTTGECAFDGETNAERLVAVMRQEPERSETFEVQVPAPLRSIIVRCLAKDPANRYESTRDLADALRKLRERLWEIDDLTTGVAMPSPPQRKRWLMAGAAVLGLALIATSPIWRRSKNEMGEEAVVSTSPAASDLRAPTQESSSRARGAARESVSLAVLPLENLGPESEGYFAAGMTDALIINLSKIKALKVISRTSVVRYRGTEMPLSEIARELDVDTVLTGSVLHAAGRVRISTQLTEVATDRNLWAESYERDLRDILALQGEVAYAVAEAVQVEVDPREKERIAASISIDSRAHDAYLRGLALLEQATLDPTTKKDVLREGIGHFQRAIEIEPEWPEPYASLANTYNWLATTGGVDLQREFYPKGRAAALRALELDDTAAVAYRVLGQVVLAQEWDWIAAEQYHRRSVELDPNHSSWAYGTFLKDAGRFPEALEQYRRARESSPQSPFLPFNQGATYLCAGDPDEAEAVAKRLIEVTPDSLLGPTLLGKIMLETSRYEEGVAVLVEVQDDLERTPWRIGWLPYGLAKSGDLAGAREMLSDLEARGFDWFPELYMALGEEDKAMVQIEAAFEARRDILLIIRCSLEYERLMELPRFREIVKAIGFPN